MPEPLTGGCLCGAIRYIVDAPVHGGRKVEFPGLGRVGGLADLKEALGKYLRESTKPPVCSLRQCAGLDRTANWLGA